MMNTLPSLSTDIALDYTARTTGPAHVLAARLMSRTLAPSTPYSLHQSENHLNEPCGLRGLLT